jgi:hypothetical protein
LGDVTSSGTDHDQSRQFSTKRHDLTESRLRQLRLLDVASI